MLRLRSELVLRFARESNVFRCRIACFRFFDDDDSVRMVGPGMECMMICAPSFTQGKCSGIANQHSWAVCPIVKSCISPSSTLLKKCPHSLMMMVTK